MRRLATTPAATALRATADLTAPVVATTTAGQTVTAIAASPSWLQLTTGAATGWAPSDEAILHDVLIADLYPFDQPQPSWPTAQTSPQLAGAILKATEGQHYGYTQWFIDQWGPLRSSAGARYGDTWFRGAYHFYGFYAGAGTPAQQADFFLQTVERAGGWGPGDLPPVVDVELGGDNAAAADALTASQIIDDITAYTTVIKQALGCPVMLYGGEALRAKQITDHLGCAHLWTAEYGTALSPAAYEHAGWSSADTVLWQYTDGQTNDTGFPTKIAGIGGDLSVFRPNDLTTLAALLTWRSSN